MTVLITAFLEQIWPYLAAGAIGLVAVVIAYFRGGRREKAKQAARDLAAAQDRIEMNREATDIERHIAGQTDDQARKEAAPWVRN